MYKDLEIEVSRIWKVRTKTDSRSLITQDLEASLLRLDKVARRRVCITLATEGTPRLDLRAMRALGLTDDPGRDFQFALSILIDHGIKPQLSYIASARVDRYASVDEAYRVYAKMVDDFYQGSSKSEKEALYVALRAWLHEHLVEDTAGASLEGTDPGKTRNTYLVFDKPRENIWAFIAWDKV